MVFKNSLILYYYTHLIHLLKIFYKKFSSFNTDSLSLSNEKYNQFNDKFHKTNKINETKIDFNLDIV